MSNDNCNTVHQTSLTFDVPNIKCSFDLVLISLMTCTFHFLEFGILRQTPPNSDPDSRRDVIEKEREMEEKGSRDGSEANRRDG